MKPDGNVDIGSNEECSKWHIQCCVLCFDIYVHVLYMKTIPQHNGDFIHLWQGSYILCNRLRLHFFLISREITRICQDA